MSVSNAVPTAVRIVQVVCAVAFVVLAVVAGLALVAGGAGASFDAILADPWGRTVVVDINAAFIALIALVWLLEPRRSVALAITVLTPVLGSFVPLVWVIVRAAQLRR